MGLSHSLYGAKTRHRMRSGAPARAAPEFVPGAHRLAPPRMVLPRDSGVWNRICGSRCSSQTACECAMPRANPYNESLGGRPAPFIGGAAIPCHDTHQDSGRGLLPGRGGLVPGTLLDIYGPGGAGKTQALLQIAAGAAGEGHAVWYVDAAGDFRARARAGDGRRLCGA